MPSFVLDVAEDTDDSIIEKLIELLNDTAKWPTGFLWNYDSPIQCTLALAHKSGLVSNPNYSVYTMAKICGMPRHIASKIFWNLSDHIYIDRTKIQPFHVAEALKKYLAGTFEKA